MRFLILFATICILNAQTGYSQMIELETQDDFEKTLDTKIRSVDITGEVKNEATGSIPFRLLVQITSDGTKYDREVVDFISMTVGGRTASFTGKSVSRLRYPKLPGSLVIHGLKPNGLLVEFSGPDGAESYRCQIQATPDKDAAMFYQDWFGGVGGGFQKVIKAGTAKFK